MENEREKRLREELRKTQDSKPRGDSLLKLIKKLQRLQASGPPAQGARSPSAEASEVARLVERYHSSTKSAFSGSDKAGGLRVLLCGETPLVAYEQTGVCRCCRCSNVFPVNDPHFRTLSHPCYGQGSEPVYILGPKH